MKNYLEEYKKWCESPDFDEETKKELSEIKDNEKEIDKLNNLEGEVIEVIKEFM